MANYNFPPEPAPDASVTEFLPPYAAHYDTFDNDGTMSNRSSMVGAKFYKHSSISDKYSLSASPAAWGTPLSRDVEEPDDNLHNPEEQDVKGWTVLSSRGMLNVGCLFIMVAGLLALFVGYPVAAYYEKRAPSRQGGFNLGGINATGQIPELHGKFGLIDPDTPREVYTKQSYRTGEEMVLVFSDEFEQDGRTFYPGDDPYWQALDSHYYGTNNLEWYDPSQATTSNGSLQLTIDRAIPELNHGLDFKGGMIQSWNKFCFTGGLLEVSVRLPGSNNIAGLWPAVWTMGNLGRAGFGGTVEGLWPYTYDSCDVGTLPNQTYPGTMTPVAAVTDGDPYNFDMLSYLPGQRLSACTCPGESHPGPIRRDGSYVGRSAPEIDMFEAAVTDGVGHVSMSGQWAPFNAKYQIHNSSGETEFDNPDITHYNEYTGGVWQQATSGLSLTNPNAYELSGGLFATYAFEYKPGFDDAYITWVNDGKRAWTLWSEAMTADIAVEIDSRPVPQEPMYIIMNLGMSANFGLIDLDNLIFPATMSVDWVRVYQPADRQNIGCDPDDFPTAKYIQEYQAIYNNPNITTWVDDGGQPWPKNRLMDEC